MAFGQVGTTHTRLYTLSSGKLVDILQCLMEMKRALTDSSTAPFSHDQTQAKEYRQDDSDANSILDLWFFMGLNIDMPLWVSHQWKRTNCLQIQCWGRSSLSC